MMSSLRRVFKKYCSAHVVARVVYLFSATIMCCGVIMDVIMIVNILLPYLRIVNFAETKCTHVSTVVTNKQNCYDEALCPKTHTQTEPCINTTVEFQYTQADGKPNRTRAMLKHNEYNVLSSDICSYETLYTSFYWQNENEVERFRRQYGVPGTNYTCYYDPTTLTKVIVHKEHDGWQVMHAVLWPSLCIVLGLVLVVIFYAWVGCDLWGPRIATVMWDKSLKRIEMEQEIRRRTNNNFNNNRKTPTVPSW